jgi:hypothetical protein
MLQRKDWLAFIERIVDTAIAPPSTAMFAFPNRLTAPPEPQRIARATHAF